MIKELISHLLFGTHCEYCSEIIPFGETLCPDCKSESPRITGEKCKYCGVGKDRCNCKNAKMKYDGISAPFYYEKSIKKSIQKFKFADKPFLAKKFARDAADAVRKDFGDIKFDFIDFIPFDKSQNAKRKYNPAYEIAKEISAILEIPVCHILVKSFSTESQHTAAAQKRFGNVGGAYDVKDCADTKGKTVLLVDDIKTTGATLSECSKVLKIAGADKVYCIVVAIRAEKENR